MAQLPSWTSEVSEQLMDIQIVAQRMVDADGVRTPTEQALLDMMVETQGVIQEVEDEIAGVLTTIRTGKRPRRMLRALAHDAPTMDAPEPEAA